MEAVNPFDRQSLVDDWRLRLDIAYGKYRSSVEAAKAATSELNGGLTPIPDGTLHVRTALKTEAATRTEYMRILRIFTDLTVMGKIPDVDK